MTAKLIRLVRRHEDATSRNTDKPSPSSSLSLQEALVLRLLAAGASTYEIADHLPINEPAVKEHIKALLRKARARNEA